MRKYKIVYQSNAYTTEYFVKADDAEMAEKKFREVKGENPMIIKIEEVPQ